VKSPIGGIARYPRCLRHPVDTGEIPGPTVTVGMGEDRPAQARPVRYMVRWRPEVEPSASGFYVRQSAGVPVFCLPAPHSR